MKQATLGYLVSTKMNEKGYSVAELSDISNISKPSIYNLLGSKTKKVTSITFIKIINALEFSNDEIEKAFEYMSF